MTDYVDVFSNDEVPPAGLGYQALSINGATNPSFWPYNYTGTGIVISKIIDATPGSGGTLQLPDATQVSVGEDVLIFNVGANTLTIQSYTGGAVTTIAAGAAKYLYLKTNTTTAGTWGVVTYGTGTSSADAAALAGYGLSALGGATLNTAFTSTDKSALFTLDNTYRAKLVNATSGTWTLTLQAAATATSTFFFLIRNSGSGIITIDPNGTETIDGATTKDIRSGESAIIICNGTGWFSVGYGRAVQGYTLLSQSVTAGGTIALTAAQALNQLINFTGSPAAAVTVTVPNAVGLWYITNSSTQNVAFGGVTGTRVTVAPGASQAVKCDGTNSMVAIQTAANFAGMNALYNPGPAVWQRGFFGGIMDTTGVRYFADRWACYTGVSVATYEVAPSYTGATYHGLGLRRSLASTATTPLYVGQALTVLDTASLDFWRDSTGAAATQVTLSFEAQAGANWSGGAVTFALCRSSALTAASDTFLNMVLGLWNSQVTTTSTFTPDTNWTRYSMTFSYTASGLKQIGIWFKLQFSGTAGASDILSFRNFKLEPGGSATDYEERLFNEELIRCQAFYEKSFPVGVPPITAAGLNTGETRFTQVVGVTTSQNGNWVPFRTRKHYQATGVVTIYNPSAANAQIRNNTVNADWSSTSTSTPTETGFSIGGTSPGGSAVGNSAAFHWTADYEL